MMGQRGKAVTGLPPAALHKRVLIHHDLDDVIENRLLAHAATSFRVYSRQRSSMLAGTDDQPDGACYRGLGLSGSACRSRRGPREHSSEKRAKVFALQLSLKGRTSTALLAALSEMCLHRTW